MYVKETWSHLLYTDLFESTKHKCIAGLHADLDFLNQPGSILQMVPNR